MDRKEGANLAAELLEELSQDELAAITGGNDPGSVLGILESVGK